MLIAAMLGAPPFGMLEAQRTARLLPERELVRPFYFRSAADDLGADRTSPAPNVGAVAESPSPDSTRMFRPNGWSILASALVPGAGQALKRQRRSIAYFALESYAWSSFASHRRVARRSRDGYRSLASSTARASFSSNRPVGDFDYYERMEHYVASGVFDRSLAGTSVEPEIDTSTFNGATWLLARRTYWTDPFSPPPRGSVEWTRAETFYLQRAIRPEFRWSWEGAASDYARFRRLIRQSNDRYRSALSDLGLALGNHVLSAIDASVSFRLDERRTAMGREYSLGVEFPISVALPRWRFSAAEAVP